MSAQTTTLLPPVGGMDLKSPLANMNPINSPYIKNFDTDGAKLSLRPGIQLHVDMSDLPGAGLRGIALGTYSSNPNSDYKLYLWLLTSVAPSIYDVTTAPGAAVRAVSGAIGRAYVSSYNKRLWFGTETVGTQQVWDGAAWAATAFTDSTATAIVHRFTISYKSRAYLFKGGATVGPGTDSSYYYTIATGNVAGQCVQVELASIFETKGPIAFMAPFSQADGVTNELYLAIGNSAGEVLFYNGDYPGSSNWTIVGRGVIGKPLGYQPTIPYQNDCFIMTDTGVTSLRNLFLTGVDASISQNITENIDPLWGKLVAATGGALGTNSGSGVWSGVFWPEQNKIVILRQGAILESGAYWPDSATFFVYDCTSKAWTTYIWESGTPINFGATNLTWYNGDLYFICDKAVMRMSTDYDFVDTSPTGTEQNIEFVCAGPHQSLISQTNTKKIEGFEVLLKTDNAGSNFGMTCVSDFGRRTSAQSKVDIVVGTSEEDGYNRVKYSCGTEGSFYQYKISGEANLCQYGLEIYSVSTIFTPGGTKG